MEWLFEVGMVLGLLALALAAVMGSAKNRGGQPGAPQMNADTPLSQTRAQHPVPLARAQLPHTTSGLNPARRAVRG